MKNASGGPSASHRGRPRRFSSHSASAARLILSARRFRLAVGGPCQPADRRRRVCPQRIQLELDRGVLARSSSCCSKLLGQLVQALGPRLAARPGFGRVFLGAGGRRRGWLRLLAAQPAQRRQVLGGIGIVDRAIICSRQGFFACVGSQIGVKSVWPASGRGAQSLSAAGTGAGAAGLRAGEGGRGPTPVDIGGPRPRARRATRRAHPNGFARCAVAGLGPARLPAPPAGAEAAQALLDLGIKCGQLICELTRSNSNCAMRSWRVAMPTGRHRARGRRCRCAPWAGRAYASRTRGSIRRRAAVA